MGFAPSDMQLSSTAFSNHGAIPASHTGEGKDVSPALAWSNPPSGTEGYAIICHDPDAPLVSQNGTYGFVHWVLYNIPGDVHSLSQDNQEYTCGKNDVGNVGYNGPMPPPGHGTHHYYYWVLALGRHTALEPGLTLWELLKTIEPDLLGMNRLIGTYRR